MSKAYSNFAVPHILIQGGEVKPNINYGYGTYEDADVALEEIATELGDTENIPFGLTIGIRNEDDTLTEYYWNGSDFVVKNAGGGSGGTSNYNELDNKPSINSKTLTGNKTLAELGIAAASHTHAIDDVNGLQEALNDISGLNDVTLEKTDTGIKITFTTDGGEYYIEIPYAAKTTTGGGDIEYTYGLLSAALSERLYRTLHYINDVATINDLPALKSAAVGATYRVEANDKLFTCVEGDKTSRVYTIKATHSFYTETEGGIDYYAVSTLNTILTGGWTYGSTATGYGTRCKPLQVDNTYYIAVCSTLGEFIMDEGEYIVYVADNTQRVPTIDAKKISELSTSYVEISVFPTVPQTIYTKYWYITSGISTTTDYGKKIDEIDFTGNDYSQYIIENDSTYAWAYASETDDSGDTYTGLKSGNGGTNSSTSSVKIQGFGGYVNTITFGQSSEANFDYCTIYDSAGTALATLKGSDYQGAELTIDVTPLADGILTFTFTKDVSTSKYQDAFYLTKINRGSAA